MDFPHKAFCPPPFSCSAPLQSNSHFHTGLSFGFVLPPLRTHSLHTSQVWFHCVRSAHRCWRLPSELESRVLLCCCKPKAPGGFFLSARFHCIFFPFSSLRLSFQPTQKFCRLYFFLFYFSLSSAAGVYKPAAGMSKDVCPHWWFSPSPKVF